MQFAPLLFKRFPMHGLRCRRTDCPVNRAFHNKLSIHTRSSWLINASVHFTVKATITVMSVAVIFLLTMSIRSSDIAVAVTRNVASTRNWLTVFPLRIWIWSSANRRRCTCSTKCVCICTEFTCQPHWPSQLSLFSFH